MIMKEKLVKKNLLHKGKAVDFYCDDVMLPNKHMSKREYLGHPGAAAVLPFLDERLIVLVKQYRYPINEITLELPAGKLEKGENPLKAIRRELKEETGYKAKTFQKMISFYPSTTFSTELLHIYAAFDLTEGKSQPDVDEIVNKEILPIGEAIDMLFAGKIRDCKTVIALLFWHNLVPFKLIEEINK
ncbi:MAG: NUDIX hydrolase [Elusimicrobiota bacterium]|jgi:ADP-ribose pyrophosphatase|nr:NUDIX hydrolase [Elusimicrobiota bacterium]